jgi:hypothetical protein
MGASAMLERKELFTKQGVLLVLAFLTLTGCASTPINQELYTQYLTRTYTHSKNKCFDATLAALKDLKIGVETKDKGKGLITTERADFFRRVEYSGSGQTFVAAQKYYLKITGNQKSATVTAYRYRYWKNHEEQTELSASWCKENAWDPFFKTIEEKLGK